jgi:hypothetical protein
MMLCFLYFHILNRFGIILRHFFLKTIRSPGNLSPLIFGPILIRLNEVQYNSKHGFADWVMYTKTIDNLK